MGEQTILCSEVCQHVGDADIGKSKGVVIKGHEVQAIDGVQDLFLEFLMDGGSKGQFDKFGIIQADGFGDLELHGSGSMDRCRTWVCWHLECNSSEHKVFGQCDDKAEVAMAAATPG